MRISTGLVLALTLAVAAGCKKKKDEGGTGTTGTDTTGTGSGTGMAGTGMAGTGSAAPEPEKPLAGADLAKRYLECAGLMNSGDFEKFKTTCVAANFVMKDAVMNRESKADEALAEMADMKKAFADMKMEPQLVLVNGRNIAAAVLSTGTMSGDMKTPMGDMKATNKKIGQMFFHRLKLDDTNKTTEEWFVMDVATFLVQAGILTGKNAPPARPAMDKGMDGAPVIVVAADDAKEKANLEAYKKGNEAFNAHKVADAMAFYAPDAVETDLASDKDVKGTKDIQKGTEMFVKAFPDGKYAPTEEWAAGDYVVSIGEFTGTNTGPLGKMKKTGKPVKVAVAEIASLKDGKITQLWRFRDTMSMMTQLGLIKDPAAGGAPPPTAKPEEGADPKKGGDMKKDDAKKDEPKKDEPKKDEPK